MLVHKIFSTVLVILVSFFLSGCNNPILGAQGEQRKKLREYLKNIEFLPTHKKVELEIPEAWSIVLDSVEIGAETDTLKAIFTILSNVPEFKINAVNIKEKTGIKYRATKVKVIDFVKEIADLADWMISISPDGAVTLQPDQSYLCSHNMQFITGSKKSYTKTKVGEKDSESSGTETLLSENIYEEVSEMLSSLQRRGDIDAFNILNGFVSVHAKQKVHKQIDKFLRELRHHMETQIYIDMKIIEFSSSTGEDLVDVTFDLGTFIGGGPGSSYGVANAVSLLKQYGVASTLTKWRARCRNRVAVMCGRTATLTTFEKSTTTTPGVGNGTVNTQDTSVVKTVPVGMQLYILPTVTNNDMVLVTIQLTMSSLGERKFYDRTTKNEVDQIKKVVLDAEVCARSGELSIVGGFNNEELILGQVGISNGAIRARTPGVSGKEIYIILKADILRPQEGLATPRNLSEYELCPTRVKQQSGSIEEVGANVKAPSFFEDMEEAESSTPSAKVILPTDFSPPSDLSVIAPAGAEIKKSPSDGNESDFSTQEPRSNSGEGGIGIATEYVYENEEILDSDQAAISSQEE